jgi:hypothetical protein
MSINGYIACIRDFHSSSQFEERAFSAPVWTKEQRQAGVQLQVHGTEHFFFPFV